MFDSPFRPGWWIKNRHMQTIWGAVFRSLPRLPQMRRMRLELNDGDFIDVDIHERAGAESVLILHGLEGSIDSHYMRGIVSTLAKSGKQVAVMHFRGCSGESNRLLSSYHSGISDDLQLVIELLTDRKISVDYLVGFSLGGNVLLKWLGENHQKHSVRAAAAVSVPMLLNECANAIDQGFSKVYSGRLLKTLKEKTRQKKQVFNGAVSLDMNEIKKLNSFWEFDHKVTAPLHGFNGASDYYSKASSRQFLKSISIPTLIIHAKDDPFMNEKVIPEADELSSSVQFELSANGGHVGFVSGRWPWRAEYYLERRISTFIDDYAKS
ncbi:hydrolase [Aliikangiella coralliicola]|uniref:Hydrolase n=2 Tax=Aliikangiella coralliicola TaxID=2592383 RepID=A0A545UI02_9GAMM|nr:hydrolase [Aliikangiella coralliicola]